LVLLREGAVYCSGSPGEVLTEETIRNVYGARVLVLRDGGQANPQILPIAGDNEIKGQKFSP
jgi:ABC-type hemin transport system ATPase subunit